MICAAWRKGGTLAIEPFSILGSALYSHLGSVLGTIPVYQDIAPQGSQPPYAIFGFIAASETYTWDSEEVQAQYQVKMVSNREGPGEATRLYKSVHSATQDAPLAVGGSVSLLRCRRSGLVRYQDPKRFWHVGGIYRVDIIGEA